MTAAELQAHAADAHERTQLVHGLADQARLRGMIADTEGETLVARIHNRKRLATALEAPAAGLNISLPATVLHVGGAE